ncbi:hypothetical protein [Methylobacter sp. S3L5C]|uniref:hypothetical protein n=1 Tax=Methylobacter sp. S3L5C TaxID=2839024 RepID=UPI001FABC2C7|nr:hypothetical protein [Methylobacter sp. S3L5C]UOA08169.1 hypothetical protein KKZ03_18470 [Methylobacter sp. S3L5C]
MKILHIPDYSILLHNGCTTRTKVILGQQQKPGWQTFHANAPKHAITIVRIEEMDGFTFFCLEKPKGLFAKIPSFN